MVVISRTEIEVERFNKLYGGSGLEFGNTYHKAVEECKIRVQSCVNDKLNSSGLYRDGYFSTSSPKTALFIDPECPQHKTFSNIEQHIGGWKRLRAILPAGELVKDGVDSTDIKQGQIGDCYYVSALSVVALQPERLFRCLVSYDIQKGVYGFIFYKHGRWTPVIIDGS